MNKNHHHESRDRMARDERQFALPGQRQTLRRLKLSPGTWPETARCAAEGFHVAIQRGQVIYDA